MTWNNFRKPVEHGGVVYGTKEREFISIETLPQLVPAQLEVAAGGNDAPREKWRGLGWSVIDSHSRSATAGDYRDYIQGSRGEFSVAKNLYVATRCGWFSCRTVCYLAAGKPAVLQDTGFTELIPTGCGLFAFSDLDSARDAICRVEADYQRHSRAALALAHECFDSRVVLGGILREIGMA
jgi:hypothetical protein